MARELCAPGMAHSSSRGAAVSGGGGESFELETIGDDGLNQKGRPFLSYGGVPLKSGEFHHAIGGDWTGELGGEFCGVGGLVGSICAGETLGRS